MLDSGALNKRFTIVQILHVLTSAEVERLFDYKTKHTRTEN